MKRQIVGRMRAKRLRERVKAATGAAGGTVRGENVRAGKRRLRKGEKDPIRRWGGSVGESRWWCIGSLRSAEYVYTYVIYVYIFTRGTLYGYLPIYARV